MKVLFIESYTADNETCVEIFEAESLLDHGVKLCMMYADDLDGVTEENIKDSLLKDGEWLSNDDGEADDEALLIDAVYQPKGKHSKVDMFTLQVWTEDVLGRFNITLIEFNESTEAALAAKPM